MTVNAVVLMALIYGATLMVKALVPQVELDRRLQVATAVVLSFGFTFLVSASVWAHEQVIGGHPLDNLSVASKVVVAFAVAFGSSAIHEGVKTVSNIGQNQPQKPIAK